jgi:hypothetical protein
MHTHAHHTTLVTQIACQGPKRNNSTLAKGAKADATYIVPALARHAPARVDEDAIVAVRVHLLHLFDEF